MQGNGFISWLMEGVARKQISDTLPIFAGNSKVNLAMNLEHIANLVLLNHRHSTKTLRQ